MDPSPLDYESKKPPAEGQSVPVGDVLVFVTLCTCSIVTLPVAFIIYQFQRAMPTPLLATAVLAGLITWMWAQFRWKRFSPTLQMVVGAMTMASMLWTLFAAFALVIGFLE